MKNDLDYKIKKSSDDPEQRDEMMIKEQGECRMRRLRRTGSFQDDPHAMQVCRKVNVTWMGLNPPLS